MSPSDSQPPSMRFAVGADVAVGLRARVVRAHEDLADLTRIGVGAVGAHDLHLAGERPADRAAVREPVGAADDASRLRLGAARRAPRSRPGRASRSTSPSATAGTARRDATRPSTTTRRSGRARRVGQLRDPRHHRRHDVHRLGAVLVDQLQACAPRRTCRRAPRDCPRAAPVTDHMNGPLWYSGPGIMSVPFGVIISSGCASGSIERGRGVEDQLRAAGAAARRHALPRIRHGVEPRLAGAGGAGVGRPAARQARRCRDGRPDRRRRSARARRAR